jgi:hypothetical protein
VIIAFLSIIRPESYVYLSPWLDVVESIAMGSFFLLLCEFVSESRAGRNVFFVALVVANKKAPNGQRGGLRWYRVCSLSIIYLEQRQRVDALLETLSHDIPISCRFLFSSDYYKHNSSSRLVLPVQKHAILRMFMGE